MSRVEAWRLTGSGRDEFLIPRFLRLLPRFAWRLARSASLIRAHGEFIL